MIRLNGLSPFTVFRIIVRSHDVFTIVLRLFPFLLGTVLLGNQRDVQVHPLSHRPRKARRVHAW